MRPELLTRSYVEGKHGPNKQRRVIGICKVAKSRAENGRRLAERPLEALRLDGIFRDPANGKAITALRDALTHAG